MRWELSLEQRAFQAALAGWLKRHGDPRRVHRWFDAGDPGPFEARFADEGWLSVGSPPELGGQGGGLIELALIAEELGRTAVPSSAWLGSILAVPALAAAPEAAKALLTGAVITVLAVPADGIPGPTGSVTVEDGRLYGSVASVLGADRARRLVVPAVVGPDLGLFLVELGADAVTVRPRSLLDRSRTAADLEFCGATGAVLVPNAGPLLAEAALRAAVLVAADALGAAQRMLDLAVEYSGQRRQFGVPIGSFQAVKHAAATMLVNVEAARSIVYLAAASLERDDPQAPLQAAVAKAQVTQSAQDAADSALTLHGAIGYTWEHDLQLFYKRAKLDHRLFGSPSAWNERIAAALDLLPTPTS